MIKLKAFIKKLAFYSITEKPTKNPGPTMKSRLVKRNIIRNRIF